MTHPMHMSEGVKDLYPSERNAILSIKHQLMSELAYQPATILFTDDMMKRQFEERARNRCGEIGFIVSVQWTWDDPETGEFSPDVADDPNDFSIIWRPRLIIEQRVKKLTEVDHDRMKHEIVTGEADGQAGFMREDGSKHEEPIRKTIL